MPTRGESSRCRPSVRRNAEGARAPLTCGERRPGPRCPRSLSTSRRGLHAPSRGRGARRDRAPARGPAARAAPRAAVRRNSRRSGTSGAGARPAGRPACSYIRGMSLTVSAAISQSGGPVRLRHPREVDVHALAVRQHGRPDALAIRGQAVVDLPAGVAAQPVEVALEPVVEDEAQAGSAASSLLIGIFCRGHCRYSAAAARLPRWEASTNPMNDAARRLAPKGIFDGLGCLGRGRLGRLLRPPGRARQPGG